MKKHIYFEVEEIEKLLEIADGEVICTQWKAKRDTIKEMLQYGEQINSLNEIPEQE